MIRAFTESNERDAPRHYATIQVATGTRRERPIQFSYRNSTTFSTRRASHEHIENDDTNAPDA